MYQKNPLLESEDKESKNRGGVGERLLAGLGASYIGSKAPLLASRPLINKMKLDGPTYSDSTIIMTHIPESIAKLKVNNSKSVADYMREKKLYFNNDFHPAGPNFNPITNTIHLPIKDKYMDTYGKSIFAHELGHSLKLQSKPGQFLNKRMYAYIGSKQLTNGVAFAQLINCFRSDDESRQKVGKALSVAGGVSALPMIAEEIGASMRGTKMLGLKGMDKARAFIGVGSYITLALSPTIMYSVSETTRKFLRALKKAKQESPEVNANIEKLKQQNVKVKI